MGASGSPGGVVPTALWIAAVAALTLGLPACTDAGHAAEQDYYGPPPCRPDEVCSKCVVAEIRIVVLVKPPPLHWGRTLPAIAPRYSPHPPR